MQNDIERLRSQIAEVETTVRELERRQLAGTVAQLLQAERSLADNRALLVRLQDALRAAESAAEDARKGQARAAKLAELADLEAQHGASMAVVAHAANVLAQGLENTLETIEPERLKVLEIADAHRYLHKQIHGMWPTGSQQLGGRAAELPSKQHLRGEAASEFFEVAALALMIAVHTRLGGPMSLKMVRTYLSTVTAR